MNAPAGRYLFLIPPATLARGSITQRVTAILRDAIVTLALKPGEALDKNAICARLGVSRFPVSEALARLQAEGLVDIAPQRGSTVSLIYIGDVIETMTIRKALEAEAVRIATLGREPRLAERLALNLEAQRTAAAADDRSGFHRLDLEFHDMLSGSLGFARLAGIIDSTRANLDRARRLIITPRRLAESLREHQEIAAAISAGGPDTAARAMRLHIDSVMAELLAFARAKPDLFGDNASHQSGEDEVFPFG